MFCRHCGQPVQPQAVACPSCGVPPHRARKFCSQCGVATLPEQVLCVKCGTNLAPTSSKSKVAAGLLGLFLGGLGIHKFYLGYTAEGVITLLISLVAGVLTCGMAFSVMHVIGLIEGIIYLTKSDEDFEQMYVRGRHGWF